jgi:hypothetical protein
MLIVIVAGGTSSFAGQSSDLPRVSVLDDAMKKTDQVRADARLLLFDDLDGNGKELGVTCLF